MPDLSSELALALDLARTAEAEILPRFRTVTATQKPDGTEVTEADREAERVMREQLSDARPDHAVLGEEFGDTGPDDARYRWVLDPVDGTAGFTIGVPLFGTLVALLEDGVPVVGVIHFPALDETVYAARGEGCRFRTEADEMAVRVDPVPSVADATITTTALHSSDVTAAPDHVPQPLREQLAVGGRMVIPIGPRGGYQTLWQFVKQPDGEMKAYNKGGVAFVPFTGKGIRGNEEGGGWPP